MSDNNVVCAFCGKSFHKKPSQVKRSKNHYCCREHLDLSLARDVPIGRCDQCGKEIRLVARKRRNSKSGLYFCGVQCRNEYVAKHSRWSKDPISHRKRTEFLRKSGKNCFHCGYDKDLRMLDVHHIDENHRNNEWSNLSLLCVWCHAKHHRGVGIISVKPVFKDLHEVERKFLEKLKSETTVNRIEGNKKAVRTKVHKYGYSITDHSLKICPNCKRQFESNKATQVYCSQKCHCNSKRKADRPTREELQDLMNNNSWCAIGRMYKVSDNAVRKWARSYGIL